MSFLGSHLLETSKRFETVASWWDFGLNEKVNLFGNGEIRFTFQNANESFFVFTFKLIDYVVRKSTENSITFDNTSVIDRRLLKILGDGAVNPICSCGNIYLDSKYSSPIWSQYGNSLARSGCPQNPPRWVISRDRPFDKRWTVGPLGILCCWTAPRRGPGDSVG